MYRIITSEINEVLESLDYVKLQDNGVMVLCDEKEAQGILTKDHSTILALKDKGLEDKYELCQIQKINLDQYLEEYLKPSKDKVEALEKQNQMLTDCILEMADIIYA